MLSRAWRKLRRDSLLIVAEGVSVTPLPFWTAWPLWLVCFKHRLDIYRSSMWLLWRWIVHSRLFHLGGLPMLHSLLIYKFPATPQFATDLGAEWWSLTTLKNPAIVRIDLSPLLLRCLLLRLLGWWIESWHSWRHHLHKIKRFGCGLCGCHHMNWTIYIVVVSWNMLGWLDEHVLVDDQRLSGLLLWLHLRMLL